MELPKRYNPEESEIKWMKYWEKEEIYRFDPESDKEIYSIDTPPPTVSGKMHMGHAFGNSQQDFIARFRRMLGFNVLQPFGTDDNGLPTQTLIQKLKKVRATDMSRKEFTQLCLDTLEKELKPQYLKDWKRLGISCDFNVKYSTIDPHSRKISQKSFLDLHKKGRQYRAESAAMYCPHCKTAIAQVECEDLEKESSFNDIIFKVGNENLVIATTRPELLPACVAIFYHPEDKRYQHLKGKTAKVPLFDFEVPILEDERPDPEKGTGIVMCCTFGDMTDAEWQKAYNLPIKEAIGKHGKMTEIAGKYEGMKIEDARKQIIQDLKENKLLIKQEPIKHTVNVHERCGTPIEFIHSKQWFVKYLDLKEQMLEWGNELEWHPKHMKNRYDNWVKGLQWDWCISRQIHFGIPFPVWYCTKCDHEILAKEEDLPVYPSTDKPPVEKCPKCGHEEFEPETDIINTWATSSLTPTIVKELFKDKPVYEKLKNKPFSLRPQGHDIISFWLFNTVVKSKLHYDMRPWDVCFINGWMLDPKGKKMSKSKGNIIEPQEMTNKYSADALRFMAGACKLGDDLAFPEKEVVTGKKTINKIFNASKFTIMNLENYKPESNDQNTELKSLNTESLEVMDKWLISKLQKTIKESTEAFEEYEFSKSKQATDIFFWQKFCDNYLEFIKHRTYGEDNEQNTENGTLSATKLSAQKTLYYSLLTQLKLFAPIMPFITEEIYHLYFKQFEKEKSIHITNWPEYNESLIDEEAEEAGDLAVEIIAEVRKHKSENKMSLKEELEKLTVECTKEQQKAINKILEDLKQVGKIKEIEFKENKELKISF